MKIKEIDGKKYIEYDEDRELRKKAKRSVIFLTLLAFAIVSLILSTGFLIKNKNIITQDPLRYGMEIHKFISCQCFDDSGIQWYSSGNGFTNQRQAGYGFEIEVFKDGTG